MLGLESACKTSILNKLKLIEVVSAFICVGFHIGAGIHGKVIFISWDIGDQTKVRLLWRHYYSNTQGFIFVIDSSDRDRIENAKVELQEILAEEELKNISLLVLANKQDLSSAMSSTEAAEKLDLVTVNDREWYIQGTCAMTGDGLYDGLEWLSNAVCKQKK